MSEERVRWMDFRRTSSTRLRSSSAVSRLQGRLRSVKIFSARRQRGSSLATSTSRSSERIWRCLSVDCEVWATRVTVRLPALEAWA